MSLWIKLGWRHWRLKHLNHFITHSVLRNWCWTMILFKNDQALIQFWINCWLQTRLTHKHGWRKTVELLFPQRTEALGGAVLCDIPKAVSFLLYHCMRRKTQLTDIDWAPEFQLPQRTGALKGDVLCDIWGRELFIIALQEAESGLKQWAIYHYIASLGDGTADADSWLKMTVQRWWFQTHC